MVLSVPTPIPYLHTSLRGHSCGGLFGAHGPITLSSPPQLSGDLVAEGCLVLRASTLSRARAAIKENSGGSTAMGWGLPSLAAALMASGTPVRAA